MAYFEYDGTFEGILTAVYDFYRTWKNEDVLRDRTKGLKTLFEASVLVETNEEKAEKVTVAICERMSVEAMTKIVDTFLSEADNREELIIKYIRKGMREGKKAEFDLTDDVVRKVNDLSRKVCIEVHRLVGLLRFEEVRTGLYYAPIEPDFNIILKLAGHFRNRFSDQKWIIFDVKRKIGLYYTIEDTEIIDSVDEYISGNEVKEQGENYEALWKNYYTNIAIKERANPKQQKQYMPKRYWKYLTEKK